MKININRKIKYLLVIVCVIFSVGACAQTAYYTDLKFQVIDQEGLPIEGVRVTMTDKKNAPVTDENGITILTDVRKRLSMRAGAQKDGYYSTLMPDGISGAGPGFTPRMKFEDMYQIVLKEVKNPVPMYAVKMNTGGRDALIVPVDDEFVGYDLFARDWVTPHGTGKIGDFLFKYEGDRPPEKGVLREWNIKLTVQFSNVRDGVIPFMTQGYRGSELKSDHLAPLDAYLSEWVQHRIRESGKPNIDDFDLNRSFYFRIRTELDEEGNIVSAYYGKMYGDFPEFDYYINPTPNDRNVEFDVEQNLFQDLDVETPTNP